MKKLILYTNEIDTKQYLTNGYNYGNTIQNLQAVHMIKKIYPRAGSISLKDILIL